MRATWSAPLGRTLQAAWRRVPPVALVSVWLILAGCGTAPSPSGGAQRSGSPAARSAPNAKVVFQLGRLAGLTNYTFVYQATNNGARIVTSGRVHALTDWVLTTTVGPKVTIFDVNGRGISRISGSGLATRMRFKSPDGADTLNGEYVSAKGLIGVTHITGVRILRAGSCGAAGVRGTLYDLKSPANASRILRLGWQACIADGSGSLLTFVSGVKGGAAANAIHLAGAGTSFEVTSIGGVGPIVAPTPAKTGTPTPRPTAPAPTGALPAGFPQSLPPPPGKVFTGSQLSTGRWYLQMAEGTDASAIKSYMARLKAKGFTATTDLATAAGDIADLHSARYSVTLEQTNFPGQGYMLTVTVAATG